MFLITIRYCFFPEAPRSLLVLDVQASQFTGWADLRVEIATEAPGIREMVDGNEFMLPISLEGFSLVS